MGGTSSFQTIRHSDERRAQWRKFSADNLPDRVDIDAQIIVYEDVAEAGNCAPRDAWLAILGVAAQSLAGFGHGLQVAQHGVLHQARGTKPLFVTADVLVDAGYAFEHVPQINAIRLKSRLHRGLSQGGGIAQHLFTQRRMQGRDGDDVHPPAEQVLGVHQ